MTLPLVSAIVSTYAAERFIRGCMEDLLEQTLSEELEIIVIDSGSPEQESKIVEGYINAHPGKIRLIRTEREPLYVAWNRAIRLARGVYLTNANTDDRHRSDSFQCLAEVLDANRSVGVAYADQWISETENETFAECEARGARLRRWPVFTHRDLMLRCIVGSQPMWRKGLHDELGFFDTRYRIAADYEMWLRVASRYELRKLNDVCGVVYESFETISGRENRLPMNNEFLEIQRDYIAKPPWRDISGIKAELAREIFWRGYQHIEGENDFCAAYPFFVAALRLDPINIKFLKTFFYRCVFKAWMSP